MKATEQYIPVVLLIMLQGGSYFWVCGWNPEVWPCIQMKGIEQYFPVVLVLTFESVDGIL